MSYSSALCKTLHSALKGDMKVSNVCPKSHYGLWEEVVSTLHKNLVNSTNHFAFLIAHSLMRQIIKMGAFFISKSVRRTQVIPNLLISRLCTKSLLIRPMFGTLKMFLRGGTVFGYGWTSPSKAT